MVWTEYPYPNATSVFEVMEYANAVSNGIFGLGTIVSIWFVLFIAFRRYGETAAFASANFITLVVSTILWSVGVVDEKAVLVLGVLLGASVLMLWAK